MPRAWTRTLLVAAPLSLVPAALVALTVPNTFTNGQVADAAAVNANFTALSTTLTKVLDVEVYPQANAFIARIDNNGAVLSQSEPFIQSITKAGTGVYNVNFTPGLFTTTPGIVVATDDQGAPNNTGWSGDYTSAANTGVTVEIKLHQGASSQFGVIDRYFTLAVYRQGTDYKAKKRIGDLLAP